MCACVCCVCVRVCVVFCAKGTSTACRPTSPPFPSAGAARSRPAGARLAQRATLVTAGPATCEHGIAGSNCFVCLASITAKAVPATCKRGDRTPHSQRSTRQPTDLFSVEPRGLYYLLYSDTYVADCTWPVTFLHVPTAVCVRPCVACVRYWATCAGDEGPYNTDNEWNIAVPYSGSYLVTVHYQDVSGCALLAHTHAHTRTQASKRSDPQHSCECQL